MTEFNWQYLKKAPIKLRTFIMGFGITRTLLKQIKFAGGQTIVNGHPRRTNYMLKRGDQVKVILPPEPGNNHLPTSAEKIDIIFEDDNFLVVNKPVGLASVPSRIYTNGSLANRVKGYYVRQGYANQRVHIVTRLDKDTSGLVLFAKHHFAHSILDKELKDKQLHKTYLAICEGHIAAADVEIYLRIGRTADSFVKRQVTDTGRMSITEVIPLKPIGEYNLIKVRLHTGRTHQIRVHMAAIHHPLIGDWLYNASNHAMQRQALHCYQLKFFDPFSNQIIECMAPIPDDMREFLDKNN